MNQQKSVKIGNVIKTKEGKKTIKFGQDNPNKPEYDYTVQVRVLKGRPKTKEEFKNAEVLAMATNPWVNLNDPHPQAPKAILNELVIWVDNE